MRYILTHPTETRPSLVVDTCVTLDDEAIERLRQDLFGMGCPTGMLFDDGRCVVLRDTFTSMSPKSIKVELDAPSDLVLAKLGAAAQGSLDSRVRRWLELLTEHWDSAIPDEPVLASHLIADIVPAASGSNVQSQG